MNKGGAYFKQIMRAGTGIRWKYVLISTLVGLPFLLYNLAGLHQKQAYTSDDVAQQLIVRDWQHGQPVRAVVGEDTFVLKLPFYAVINEVTDDSPTTILLTAGIMLGLMLLLWNIFQFMVHDSLGLGVLTSVLLCSWGGLALWWLRDPNTRNLELPLALLTCLALARWHLRPKSGWWRYGLLTAALALEVLNDPYTLYVFIIPVFAAVYIAGHYKRASFKFGLLSLVFIAAAWKALEAVLFHLGLIIKGQPMVSPPIGSILSSCRYTLEGLFQLFANQQLHQSTATRVLGLLSLAASLGISGYLLVCFGRKKAVLSDKARLCFWFGATIIVGNVFIYTISGLADAGDSHYLIGVLFGWLVMLVSLWNVLPGRGKGAIYGLGIWVVALHLVSNTLWVAASPNVDYARNTQLVGRFMKQQGVSVGFSDYWDAGINTYYANGSFKLVAMVCDKAGLGEYKWAVNVSDFPSDPKHQPFVIFLNNTIDSPSRRYNPTNSCTVNDIKQLLPGRVGTVQRIDAARSLILVRQVSVGGKQ